MPFSIDDPFIQSSLLPLALAVIMTGVLRFTTGAHHGRRLAGLSPAISFLVVMMLVQGISFPPVSSTHKLAWLVGAAIVLSAAADLRRLQRTAQFLLYSLFLAIALWWLNQRRWGGADAVLVTQVAAVFAAGLILHLRLNSLRHQGLLPVLILLFASGAVGFITLLGSSALLATLGFVLMAALGGFALWNWPKHRYSGGAGILIASCAILTMLLNQVLLLTGAEPLPLLILTGLLLVNRLSTPLIHRWQLRDAGQPLIVTFCCLLITALALAVAWYLNPIDSDSGY